ncbi:MAG TPA: polyprenol phosphomannose-dependent alpha 1,6 mannosyltransferase MptB, partial [bacterium]|nr:polyprenol phosphomannose-dependent alpha 1,6 mannosyltransferase MptB [bacterium]
MKITPLHRLVHLPLVAAAVTISALSFVRWRAAGTIGLDVVFPPGPAAEIIGILFFAAVLLVAYGYYNAVLRCDALGLTLDRTLTLAKALAVISLVGLPLLSNDIYIYLSCGQAPLNGFNPYTDVADLAASIYHRFVPPIWAEGPYCKYGPAALSLAQFAAFVGGQSPIAGLFAWKLLSLGAFFLFCDAMALLLKRFGNTTTAAGPFILLSPLLWAQGVGQGHNDLFAVLFLAGALLSLLYRRWILGALLLTAGVQIKLYLLPLFLLAIFLWHRDEGVNRRSVTTIVAAALLSGLLAALLYVPYWGGAASL